MFIMISSMAVDMPFAYDFNFRGKLGVSSTSIHKLTILVAKINNKNFWGLMNDEMPMPLLLFFSHQSVNGSVFLFGGSIDGMFYNIKWEREEVIA